MKLGLAGIVKNEAPRIMRMLDSCVQFIDCYCFTDTGSTDDTPSVVKNYFAHHKIPGIITYAPFNDWSQARNANLLAAKSYRNPPDYWLLCDADMELVVKDLDKFKKFLETRGKSYDVEQRAGQLHYANRRLIRGDIPGFYLGVTHEFLNTDSMGLIPPAAAYFVDHADGGNRGDKYKRDIRLLFNGLKDEPNNGRYFYYLAQSYRDAGDLENAKIWYKKRVEFGGWAEERWSAQVNYAHCLKDQNDEAGFIREMLVAYNMRPGRAEALYDLAHHFRMKDDQQNTAALFAEIGMTIPHTKDQLFVNNFVYEAGLKEEFAITGFYNEQKRAQAFKVCSDLSLQPGPYNGPRDTARSNIYHYIKPLSDYCPSFQWRKINFEPPENWVAMNPSVTVQNAPGRETIYCVVRTVNYRIDDQGRYIIRGTDGTANDSNPINTRNFLLSMGFDPFGTPISVDEVIPPDMPCEFKPVIGLEDMRLFSPPDGSLWASSTVRQIHWDGNCEQVLTQLQYAPHHGEVNVIDWRRMLRSPREIEKNWSPVIGTDEKLWMWRPGTTINERGELVHNNPPPLTTDVISGGSQLITSFGGLYLALVHTAHQIPGLPCRYYYHRWAVYDPTTFSLAALSLPFVFHDRVIEFAAGLARHPVNKDTLVISYGFKDCEARVATISEAEVARFIWASFK